MSGGKTGSTTKDYFGHMAWELCGGQLDFTWGLQVNNEIVWPKVDLWDTQVYPKGKQLVWIDGNVYKATSKTSVDPNGPPWALVCSPWIAGTYATGVQKLYNGMIFEVWKAPNTNVVPPTYADVPGTDFRGRYPEDASGWQYVGTPSTYSAGVKFWPINSIVAWKGRLWTNTGTGTKTEPGTPGSDWALWKVDRGSSPNPLHMTVEDLGDFYLYWGTPGQTLDASGEQILTQIGSPPMRNKAVLVGRDIKFGTSTTTPPSVVVLGGRAAVQTLVVGGACDLDDDWQCNPITYALEKMTNPILGLGMPDAMFDAISWQAEADRCAANPELYYISPLYDGFVSMRDMIGEILSYPDCWIRYNDAGKIEIGHWPHGEAAPAFDETNTIDRNALAKEPSGDSEGWGDTANSVEVSFKDWEAGFKDRTVPAYSIVNMSRLNRLQTKKVDRPFIVRSAQAMAWASELQKIEAKTKFAGDDTIRGEKASAVKPGELLKFTDDVLGQSKVQRCNRVVFSKPPDGTRKIEHETERGVAQIPYTGTPTSVPGGSGPPPALISLYQPVQVPYGLSFLRSAMSVLACRSDENTTGFDLYYRKSDPSAFQDLGRQNGFGLAGDLHFSINNGDTDYAHGTTLNVGTTINLDVPQSCAIFLYPSSVWSTHAQKQVGGAGAWVDLTEGQDYTYDPDTYMLTVLGTGSVNVGDNFRIGFSRYIYFDFDANVLANDIEAYSAVPTADQIADNEILMFIFKGDNPKQFEIVSLYEFSLVPLQTYYAAQAKRALFGTQLGGDGSHIWDSNDYFFIVKRSSLAFFEHADFTSNATNGSTSTMAIVPFNANEGADVDDVYDAGSNPTGLTRQFEYTFNDPYTPTVEWVSLLVNNVAINFANNYDNNDVFDFVFKASDGDGDLVSATLSAQNGTVETILWTATFQLTRDEIRSIEFSLPNDGTYNLVLTIRDQAGNSSALPLTDVGSVTPEVLHIVTGTAEPAPTKHSYRLMNRYVVDFEFIEKDTAATVQYQFQNLNTPWNGGAWVNAPAGATIAGGKVWGPLAAYPSGQKILWAKAIRGGHADSPVVSFKL
jgi:hypothetical protein